MIIIFLHITMLQLEHQVLEFGEEFIEIFKISWVKRSQLILQLINPHDILLIKEISKFIPNFLRILQSSDMEMKIFGNRQAQKPKSFIHLVPVSCFVHNMVWLYFSVNCDSVESLGMQLNLHVSLPLVVIERSKRIHRRRSHFSVVVNVVEVFKKTCKNTKRAL